MRWQAERRIDRRRLGGRPLLGRAGIDGAGRLFSEKGGAAADVQTGQSSPLRVGQVGKHEVHQQFQSDVPVKHSAAPG